MTLATLRTPRQPPLVSPNNFQRLVGMPGGAFVHTVGAAYYNGKTYFGYPTTNGEIRVSSYDHTTHAVVTSPAIKTGLTGDIHNAPSVLVRSSDHKIVVAFAQQQDTHIYVAISTNAEDVSAWGAATDLDATLGGTSYTYANLFQLSGESGKIYLFYRDMQGVSPTTHALCYSTSTDGGATWSAQTSIYHPTAGTSSYWSIDSDSSARIDFCVSDGTASLGDTASLYHFYYSATHFFKSDGTQITDSLPLGPSSLTKVSDGATDGSVRVPYAVASSGPHVVWAAADPAGWAANPELYLYAVYSGGWSVNEITGQGAIPNDDLYEGGLTLDRSDPTKVFLAKTSGVYQMYLYETPDGGDTWSSTQLTFDSDWPNFHPISPRDAVSGLRALWGQGPVYPQTVSGVGGSNFACAIRCYPAV